MSRPEAHIFPWRESLVVVLVAILVFWVFFKKPDIQTVVETKEIQVPVYIEVTPEPGVSKQEMLESSPSEYHPSMSSDVTVDGSPYQELIPWLEYQVKRGDTLWSLSRRFYDDPHKYLLIKSANNLKEDRIECGQKLIIPGGLAASGD